MPLPAFSEMPRNLVFTWGGGGLQVGSDKIRSSDKTTSPVRLNTDFKPHLHEAFSLQHPCKFALAICLALAWRSSHEVLGPVVGQVGWRSILLRAEATESNRQPYLFSVLSDAPWALFPVASLYGYDPINTLRAKPLPVIPPILHMRRVFRHNRHT